eukprot:CAMPEP_0174262924 /NCGR_PEP_ID=MMETSP0439-20130205/16189_1 /TAXON_ID=0 /ORGANISM="Stereomyxa ramosa, Strain Chinc5" /LENGTH=1530 /DNA_ID=CAMNT_0015347969 /DNA_START=34 /DNA_END=4626 /DNA_ORIENTATION=-
MEEDRLTCPISLELLEDPISTPCCGQTFSRDSLRVHLARVAVCPMCREDIPYFDPKTAPRNVTIAGLVDQMKGNQGPQDLVPEKEMEEETASGPSWKCSLAPVIGLSGEILPVGRLKVQVNWSDFNGETCVFIPVIDKSGSMSGKPFEQVKTALLHMLYATLSNRNVFTTIIPYSSNAEKILVPRDGSAETERFKLVENQIQNMRAGGGTNFSNAFKMIKNLLLGDSSKGKMVAKAYEKGTAEYEEQRKLGRQGLLVKGAPAFVTSAIIVFLTDGCDNSSIAPQRLTQVLKEELSGWKKKLIVHTVGFSKSHDFKFLDRLRKVGTAEGIFCYADPSDDGDTLCGKLSALADSIITSTSVVSKLTCPYSLRGSRLRDGSSLCQDDKKGDNTDDFNQTDLSFDMNDGQGSVELFVDIDPEMFECEEGTLPPVVVTFPEGSGWTSMEIEVEREKMMKVLSDSSEEDGGELETESGMWKKWIANLLEELAQEVILLAKLPTKARSANSFKLHCALLVQRSNHLEVLLQGDQESLDKLALNTRQIQSMLKGKSADLVSLNDTSLPQKTTTTSTGSKQARHQRSTTPGKPTYNWGTPMGRSVFSRNSLCPGWKDRTGFGALHQAVLFGNKNAVRSSLSDVDSVDSNGDSPLSIAAYIGRLNAAHELLTVVSRSILNGANNDGNSPLSLAMLAGHWKMVELLMESGARLASGEDANTILQAVVRSRYYNTAGRIIASGLASVDMDMLKGNVPSETLEWVMQKQAEKAMEEECNEESSSEESGVYLRKAVENGMASLVENLLQKYKCELSPDLLQICGSLKDKGIEIAKLLLKAGLDPNQVQEDAEQTKDGKGKEKEEEEEEDSTQKEKGQMGNEPILFQCAQKGWTELMEVLLDHSDVDINYQNSRGNTPLWIACAKKNIDAISCLLNAGANPNIANNKGDVPLVVAAQNNMCSAVAVLLASGANIHQERTDVNTPVTVCCRVGHDVILNTLLTKCSKGKGGKERVQAELNHFADIDGFNPLLAATEQNHVECIRVLFKHNADLEVKTAPDNPIIAGATPLHLAAYYGRAEAAFALLELGANVSAVDINGRTPLHIAVRQGCLLVVRLLKSFGADLTIKDNYGHVALYYCSDQGSGKKIKEELNDPALSYLLHAARDLTDSSSCEVVANYAGLLGCLPARKCLDVDNGDGWTPLMEAVVCDNLPFATALTLKGADPHRKDAKGLTSVFWAHALEREIGETKGWEANEEEEEAIRRVNAQRGKDVRNGLILDLDDDVSCSPDRSSSSSSSLLSKMRHSVDFLSPSDLPPPKNNCTVVAFLESLAASSKSEEQKGSLERLIRKARIVAISNAAVNELMFSGDGVSLQHAFALFAFTSNLDVFSAVNDALCSGTALRTWKPFIQLLLSALQCLPPFEGEVFRKGNSFDMDIFSKGKTITWGGFSSASKAWATVMEDTNKNNQDGNDVIFLIKTKTGRPVGSFSPNTNDEEVIILPNTEFEITNWYVGDMIDLGQANIRGNCYFDSKPKPGDTIVVELVEH